MKQIFKADDGTIFESEEECIKHEALLAKLKPANDYGAALAKAGCKGASLTRRVNAVMDFLAWQETGKLPKLDIKEKKDGN